ncbi:MAG TPA: hypothetical protein VK348_10965, partial [Planctomycetota bacterium]|nr:hypothetical protein [Planctomycetota bacterium]
MNGWWQHWRSRLPRSRRWLIGSVAAAALLLLLVAVCAGPAARFTHTRHGTEIEACGQLLPIGTPVVLWRDPGGYDAYQTKKHFDPAAMDDGKLRYS